MQTSYTRQYFGFGSTTMSAFWEAKPSFQNFATNVSYVFNGDMNGDGFAGNDLIYIPRDTGEMNFVTFTHTNGRVFTAAEQAAAFEAYIQQDPYLSKHRGEYAERGALLLPMFNRMDFSLIQDVFRNIGGKRNRRPDPLRRHELRQPAELELGRHPAHDRPRRRRRTARRS